MKTTNYKFNLPSYLITAIEYGETDTLNDDDMKSLKKVHDSVDYYMKKNNGISSHWNYGEEEYFTWNPDFGNLGCNVVDATLIILHS